MLRIALAAALLAGSTAAYADTIEEKAALCGACHGLKGVPEDKSTPIIWGQNAGYLYLQFRDFQKDARKADPMTAVAQTIVKQDALALAEYFAAKPWPNIGARRPRRPTPTSPGWRSSRSSAPAATLNSSRAIRPFPASPDRSAIISSRR